MTKSQKIAIIFLFVAVVIIFLLGTVLGAFWTGGFNSKSSKEVSSSASLLDVEFILTATASGKVKEISGNNIILEQRGHEQTINIQKDTQILSSLMQANPTTGTFTSTAPVQTNISAIKVNDMISITLVKDVSGKLVADKVYIFMSGNAQ